jgi:thiol-disulfide isomerase/thioredoxin
MNRFALLLLPLLLLVLSGCSGIMRGNSGGGGGGGGDDTDGDLLSDEFEILIGTDIDKVDTDGDGWTDTEEYFTYFQPDLESDYPYTGRYPRGPLMDGDAWDEYTAEDGWAEGDISNSWSDEDRFGDPIKLRRFYGQVILIDLSAEWCGPCQYVASTLDDEYTDRKEEGFVAIQIMLDGQTTSQEPDLDRWANDFGLTNPIVGDHEREFARRYVPGGNYGIPNYTIIDRNFEIVDWFQEGGTPNLSLIDSLLEEEPPEVEYPWPDNADEIRDELGLPDADSWVHDFDVDR